MKEKPTSSREKGHNLNVQDAVIKITASLGVSEKAVYQAIPDLLRLSDEKYDVGPLPESMQDSKEYQDSIMVLSTGINPIFIILKKTENGLEAETSRDHFRKLMEH